MILLNFSHPLTAAQLRQVEVLAGQKVERVIDFPSQIDPQQPLERQVVELADKVELSATEWQTLPLLINPPALNSVAVVLLAELHGRCGYFPVHLLLRLVTGSVPPQYEVSELLDLQSVRDGARQKRSKTLTTG
jgi:hypothetical protein